MKKVFVILLLITLLAVPLFAKNQTTHYTGIKPNILQDAVVDSFNSWNSFYWVDKSVEQGSANAHNGKLYLATTDGTRNSRGKVRSVFSLGGNFDMRIDYSLNIFDDNYSSMSLYIATGDGDFGARIAEVRQTNGLLYYESNFIVNEVWLPQSSVSTTATSGKLRIARTDSIYITYYWQDDQWNVAKADTVSDIGNVLAILEVGNDGTLGNAPDIVVLCDNFYAVADSFPGISYNYSDLKDFNAFAVKFKITTADTSKTDSLTPRIETSNDLSSWSTAFSFAEYPGDTTIKYQIFTLDSLFKYKFERYARLKTPITGLAAADTGSSEILRPTGDGTTHDWDTLTVQWYKEIDETTLDTTDYDSATAANKWLVVTCGNHTKNERTIENVQAIFRMGYDTAEVSVKFGITLGDTASALRSLSDSTTLTESDSGTYTKSFAINPYGTAWTLEQIDSLGLIIKTQSVASGGIAKLAQAYIVVNYRKGDFSPPIQWQESWYLRDGD